MNHMSVYLKNKLLTDNLRTTPVYVALFNNDVEIAQPSYKRQAVSFIEPVDGQTSNNADVSFPIATESWGTISHIGIYDSATEGNLLFKSPSEFLETINISNQYSIPKNYLINRLK
ncbi:phage tail fiber protein [Sporosarcina sp. FSL K6-5500]|uniref:phage tail fiber protein n=1 Tax=Sporosarcina sp. FSL K6-5500 TaxID=2921558 RepID=UPI0030F6570A